MDNDHSAVLPALYGQMAEWNAALEHKVLAAVQFRHACRILPVGQDAKRWLTKDALMHRPAHAQRAWRTHVRLVRHLSEVASFSTALNLGRVDGRMHRKTDQRHRDPDGSHYAIFDSFNFMMIKRGAILVASGMFPERNMRDPQSLTEWTSDS